MRCFFSPAAPSPAAPHLASASVALLLAALLSQCSSGPTSEVVVSVKDQKLGVYQNGHLKKRYPISTSKFGIGDQPNSYRTPLGKHEVIAKIGHGLPKGAVLKSRSWNGEVLKPNAPGRDPIVSRILWLRGMENSNKNAQKRFIYIHGTPEESNLGKPASYGCIRMGMEDVVEVFEEINIGAKVVVTKGALPHGGKGEKPKADPLPAEASMMAATPSDPAQTPASASPTKADPATAPAVSTPVPLDVAKVEEKPSKGFRLFGRKNSQEEAIEVTEFAKVQNKAPEMKSSATPGSSPTTTSTAKPKSHSGAQPQPQIKIGPEAPSPEEIADAKSRKDTARSSNKKVLLSKTTGR